MLVKLNQPFKYEGVEIKELNIKFESLTTRDYEQSEDEVKMMNPKFNAVSLESDTGFIKTVMCKALGKPNDYLDNLSISDFARLKVQTQTFLLTGSMALLDL